MKTSIYTNKILLGMIDIMLDFLIENKECSLCKVYNCQDSRCSNADLCKNLLFDGVMRLAKQNKYF